MAVGLRHVAAVAASLFLISFYCSVKVFHSRIPADTRFGSGLPSNEVQQLQAQLAYQKQQYAGLQRQLERLESTLNLTEAAAASANGTHRSFRIPAGAARIQQHKLAVLVPYRDRSEHLAKLVSRLHEYLTVQGRSFTIFILEQSPELLFNRGALLNVGFQLLQGSDYDHFAFQDVDTLPTARGKIQYSYPKGKEPLHLTPFLFHPAANFEDFFGGISIFTREQFEKANGYGVNFWGWGREDDNMRFRLMQHDMFPPEVPDVPKKSKRFYFEHQRHQKALEWRVKGQGSTAVYYGVNPDVPYGDAKIVSVQPHLMQDMSTGLNTTIFWITKVQAYGPAIQFTIKLYCDQAHTPWCSKNAL